MVIMSTNVRSIKVDIGQSTLFIDTNCDNKRRCARYKSRY